MTEPESNPKLISTEVEFGQWPPFIQHGLSITDNAVSADGVVCRQL